ncbi:MAG: hypothetical protein ACR2KS_03180 [Candidatus Eremiobacter antarcticus]|nr:hypothetical protein [Candidatus Eremiobacteraeota bacterium]
MDPRPERRLVPPSPAIASLTSATPAAISAAAVAAFETFWAVRLALEPPLELLLPCDRDDELLDRDEELVDFDDDFFLRRVVDPLLLALLGLRRFLEVEAVSDVTFFTGGRSAYVDELFFFGITSPNRKRC